MYLRRVDELHYARDRWIQADRLSSGTLLCQKQGEALSLSRFLNLNRQNAGQSSTRNISYIILPIFTHNTPVEDPEEALE